MVSYNFIVKYYYFFFFLQCSINSLLTQFHNKVEALCSSFEQSESEMLADVEVSYILLVQQMK